MRDLRPRGEGVQDELAQRAVSLGSTDSLIQHPAGLTHRVVPPAARASMSIADGLLRLSVGLESADALWTDLSVGLALAGSAGDDGAATGLGSATQPVTATP